MRRLPILLLSLVFATGAALAESRHYVLTPDKPLTAEDRASLEARGIKVQRVLTNGRYLVAASENRDARLEPLTAEEKIHASARREVARGRATARVTVFFHKDVSVDEARDAISAAGGALQDPLAFRFGPMQQLRAMVLPSQVTALASDERVLAVAGPVNLKIRTDNSTSAKVSRVDVVQAAPYNLTGQGVTVSLFEPAAADAAHGEFGGRLTVGFTGGGSADRRHATHVAGTISATGLDARAKGMAPNVRIHEFQAVNDEAVWLEAKLEDLKPLSVVADNNSWGYILAWDVEGGNHVWYDFAEYMGAYELTTTAPIDEIARDTDILFVHSAGNDGDFPALNLWGEHKHVDDNLNPITSRTWCFSRDGSGTDCPTSICSTGAQYCEKTRHLSNAPYDTIGMTASGKNTLAVGAIDENRQIADFSSRGPAKDGRVKPDVVARGVTVYSTVPGGGYTTSNGTSMAAPAVTGIAALMTEQWRRSFAGATPRGMELKALLIAGAEDLGTPGPDYTFGHGLVDAKATADLIIADGGRRSRIRTGALAQGQSLEMPLAVSGTQKVRVVLNWPDPEIVMLGNDPIAAKALVNDLDLKVIDPAGNTVLPYVLNRTEATAAATRGVNNVDNIEVLEIAAATPGVYRVIVTATAIKDASPQEFVVVANVDAVPPCIDIQEQNETQDTAYGALVPTQAVTAALCSAGDVDWFRFTATRAGEVTVTVRATGDTPIRATLNGAGTPRTVDVPAGESRTITAPLDFVASPVTLTLRFEPINGVVGIAPTYTFTPVFGQNVPPRRRTVRR